MTTDDFTTGVWLVFTAASALMGEFVSAAFGLLLAFMAWRCASLTRELRRKANWRRDGLTPPH